MARVDKPESPYAVAWPLYLRHGDELWLWDVLEDPLACWVVAVERDLVRLRIINDAGILPELRAFLSHVARHNVSTAGVLHPEVVLPTDEHPSISS
ncbi:MAG TPA: hypothetical protein PLD10_01565 [Rhodopila sp.]|nr:hypothetical protein [Rhodopila sp.]